MGNQKKMENDKSDADLLAKLGTDGAAWAQEFGMAFAGRIIMLDAADDDAAKLNGGTLIGWFANAISAGQGSAAIAIGEVTLADGTAATVIATADLDALHGNVEALTKQVSDLTGERDQVAGQLSELRGDVEQLQADHDTVIAERDRSREELARVANEPSLLAQEQAKNLRKVGPLKGDIDREDLETAIAGETLLVFSDGSKEIRGVKPISVSGPIWVKKPSGLVLNRSILLEGPAPGSSPYEIAGVGLFDDEGEQIAWTEFPDPVRVPAGGRMELRNSVIF